MKNFLLLLPIISIFCSCTSESENKDNVSTRQEQTTQIDKKGGQAFIENDEGATPNILNVAINSKDHTTLVTAVQEADLENALVNAGPLTVFAPTNQAFEDLPAGTVENLLKPENKGSLADILKYHVAPGSYNTDLLPKIKKLGMANNGYVMVETNGDEIIVGGAKIIGTVKASNGVVHIVDKVLIPTKK